MHKHLDSRNRIYFFLFFPLPISKVFFIIPFVTSFRIRCELTNQYCAIEFGMEVGDFFFFVPTCFSKLIVALIPVATGIAFSLGQLSNDPSIFLSVERKQNQWKRKKKEGKRK